MHIVPIFIIITFKHSQFTNTSGRFDQRMVGKQTQHNKAEFLIQDVQVSKISSSCYLENSKCYPKHLRSLKPVFLKPPLLKCFSVSLLSLIKKTPNKTRIKLHLNDLLPKVTSKQKYLLHTNLFNSHINHRLLQCYIIIAK